MSTNASDSEELELTTQDLQPSESEGLIKDVALISQLEESSVALKRESLTTLRQLNKSGNLLVESMQRVIDLSGKESIVETANGESQIVTTQLNVDDVVKCAHALANVAGAQATLVKTLKGFTR